MSGETKWEEDKRARRSLRGRQRALRHSFLRDIQKLHDNRWWSNLSGGFSKALEQDAQLDPHWIDTERYPLALYNLFTALGFEVFAGPFPRVSEVQAEYRLPLLAFHPSRAVLLDQRPTNLFADIADIQPLCPVPILGLAYNGIVWSKRRNGSLYDYPVRSLREGRRLAGALAIGHVALSYDDFKQTLLMNPAEDAEALRTIAARTGILSFLRPPIDAVPVFGQHASANRGETYRVEDFLSESRVTAASGAELSPGDVTQAAPQEALDEPERYLRELRRAKLLDKGEGGQMSATQNGWAYLRSRVLPFPLGQLLFHASVAAREEVRQIARTAFADALRLQVPISRPDSHSALLTIDDIDSFAAVVLISADAIKGNVPVSTPEAEIKSVICGVVGESAKKDWGGEQNDIFTTRVVLNGRRVPAAFLLKGPAVKGRLTIAKCGKNGDQIQRLFESSAELFVIQFNGNIDERVVAEARQKVLFLRSQGYATACCAIVDGLESARLLAAYSAT
jgi:hypothetical protein